MFRRLVKISFLFQFTKDNNVYFEFHPSFFRVKDLFSGVILLCGKSKNVLYPLHPLQQFCKPSVAFLGERFPVDQWHSWLSNPALRIVNQVLSHHRLPVTSNKATSICHTSQLGKSHRLPFSLSASRSQFPLNIIFTDVWGPAQ